MLWCFRSIEVIGADLHALSVGILYVAFEHVVDAVAAFRGFQVDVGHLLVFADGFPEDVSLIVAEVDAMNVFAGVFTLNESVLGMKCNDKEIKPST